MQVRGTLVLVDGSFAVAWRIPPGEQAPSGPVRALSCTLLGERFIGSGAPTVHQGALAVLATDERLRPTTDLPASDHARIFRRSIADAERSSGIDLSRSNPSLLGRTRREIREVVAIATAIAGTASLLGEPAAAAEALRVRGRIANLLDENRACERIARASRNRRVA